MNAAPFAKALRRNQTNTEVALWHQLRAHRLAETKWKRQQPIGNYIVDFVCLEARLIVEADGGQHYDSPADQTRDAWLAAQRFVVLRFWNNDILQNMEDVFNRILEHLAIANTATLCFASSVPLSPTPLPSRERGLNQPLPLPSSERGLNQPLPPPSREKGLAQLLPLPSSPTGLAQPLPLPCRNRGVSSLPARGGGTEGEGKRERK
ncbi:MAG: endonuclease domain-containing protein [Aeromicrobium sp.]|nr:endonuclease domain-containing protein [Burkholderiales bacterium]